MAITQTPIVPIGGTLSINDAKPIITHSTGRYNRDSNGVPYYTLKFKNKRTMFNAKQLACTMRPSTIDEKVKINWETATAAEKLLATINYSNNADGSVMTDDQAVKLAIANGLIPSNAAVAACGNSNTVDHFTQFVEDEAVYQIDGRDVNGYSKCYPAGTAKSVFAKDMERQGISVPEPVVVAAVDDADPF